MKKNDYYSELKDFINKCLQKGVHYKKTSPQAKKPSLTKAGAEKIFKVFLGIVPQFKIIQIIDDKENFVFEVIIEAYIDTENLKCQAWGSYSTAEKTKLDLEGLKREYFKGKNNCIKMAQKRAMVALALIVSGASEFFTQDLEDNFEDNFEDVKEIENKIYKINDTEIYYTELAQKIKKCNNLQYLSNIWNKYKEIINKEKSLYELIKIKGDEIKANKGIETNE